MALVTNEAILLVCYEDGLSGNGGYVFDFPANIQLDNDNRINTSHLLQA